MINQEIILINQTTISLYFITFTTNAQNEIESSLTRVEVEELSSKFGSKIILEGSSTRIITKLELIEKMTQKDLNVTMNPRGAMALGDRWSSLPTNSTFANPSLSRIPLGVSISNTPSTSSFIFKTPFACLEQQTKAKSMSNYKLLHIIAPYIRIGRNGRFVKISAMKICNDFCGIIKILCRFPRPIIR